MCGHCGSAGHWNELRGDYRSPQFSAIYLKLSFPRFFQSGRKIRMDKERGIDPQSPLRLPLPLPLSISVKLDVSELGHCPSITPTFSTSLSNLHSLSLYLLFSLSISLSFTLSLCLSLCLSLVLCVERSHGESERDRGERESGSVREG